MNCCNSVRLPSMGRRVVHPERAKMRAQAVKHFMGCLDGKAELVAEGNRRVGGLRTTRESQNFHAMAKSAP
jgi:hypothetical protein